MNKRDIGKDKEKKAADYLEKNGITVKENNYYGKYGEIDIVAEDGKTVVFVEVKYRKSEKCGKAEESVSKTKMKRLYITAMEYLTKKRIANSVSVRFDLIAINGTKINWIKNSFYRDWETDRKSTRLNSSHSGESRMPSSA